MSGKEDSAGIALLRHGRELILYDTGLLTVGDLERLLDGPARPQPGGRAGVERIAWSGGEAVRRRYRRGGWMAPLGPRYLYFGARWSRPFREWRLLRDLGRSGLPVPDPLAARLVRTGPYYRGEIWTRAVEGRPLPLAAADPGGAGAAEAGAALGAVLRCFHDAGVDHPDLHVGNILVRGRGRRTDDYTLLDFDRGRRRRGGRWRARNLSRLARSLGRLPLSPAERAAWWWALLAGYGGEEIKGDGAA